MPTATFSSPSRVLHLRLPGLFSTKFLDFRLLGDEVPRLPASSSRPRRPSRTWTHLSSSSTSDFTSVTSLLHHHPDDRSSTISPHNIGVDPEPPTCVAYISLLRTLSTPTLTSCPCGVLRLDFVLLLSPIYLGVTDLAFSLFDLGGCHQPRLLSL